MKLKTFFILNIRDIYTKLSRFSDSSVKIKDRSRWTFLVIFLHQQLFARKDFSMETRLSNIFKTTNAMALTETILESTYTVV